MFMSNCTGLVWKYRWHWNRKLLSLLGSVLLKVLEIWALVLLELVLGLGVWLELRVLASWPSTLANCSLVLSLHRGLDRERVEEVGLLAIKLVIGLKVGASSQLGSLSTGTILGPGTGETVQPGWIVLKGDLRDKWPLWWIRFEYRGAFGGYAIWSLKREIMLKGVLSGGTRVEELWWEEAI